MWLSALRGVRRQHHSRDPGLRGAEHPGCPLPLLLSPKASCWSRDPRGAGVNACCVLRSWDGGLPAQRPAPRFYQTFQRVFLFAWKPNKHPNVQKQPGTEHFPAPFPVAEAARGYHSHYLETFLFNTFIARTETSTQGSAQHRHSTSRGGLWGSQLHGAQAGCFSSLSPTRAPKTCSWDRAAGMGTLGSSWRHLPPVVPTSPLPAQGCWLCCRAARGWRTVLGVPSCPGSCRSRGVSGSRGGFCAPRAPGWRRDGPGHVGAARRATQWAPRGCPARGWGLWGDAGRFGPVALSFWGLCPQRTCPGICFPTGSLSRGLSSPFF